MSTRITSTTPKLALLAMIFSFLSLDAAEGPGAAVVLGESVSTTDAEELRSEVLRRLTDRFAQEKHIEVSAGEVTSYLAHQAKVMAADRLEKQAWRDDLAKKLGAAKPGTDEAELKRQLKAADEFLKDTDPAKSVSEEDQKARAQIATAFIRQWKIHAALHEQYGGRIARQQGVPEPVDALRKFLEAHQERGNFKIASEALAAAFWRHYREDSLHDFVPTGSAEEAQIFKTAPWQSSPASK